ncbi:MAG: hypothetical protein J5669_04390 [Bacteroidales bacterium]|nr:hypothetical protein [Bacteroidales bacterium]
MKKLVFALALLCTLQAAFAQKPDAEMQKAVDKAVSATQDAKKAAKAATWVNLGKAYLTAYTNPTAGVTQVDKATWAMMNKEQALATEMVTLNGAQYEKISYSHFDVYFNAGGQLEFAYVTKPSVPGDLLMEAAKAYSKAFELGAKEKEMDDKLQEIANHYASDAYNAYTLGDMGRASDLFMGAYEVSVLPPCSVLNDDCAYNSALTAMSVENYDRAMKYYKICLGTDYGKNGDVFARVADVYGKQGDVASQKATLEEGFAKYPQNQSILIGLINYAEANNEDPNYVLSLLAKAKENEPNNASIYGVEGNILAEMKRYDEAEQVFRTACEMDPSYHYGFYAWGKMWYDRAVEFQVAADELPLTAPQREYDAIIKNRDESIAKCIEPLEKCFNASEDVSYKVACAEYLRRAYYQLSNSTNGYKEKSDFYKEYVDANGQQ